MSRIPRNDEQSSVSEIERPELQPKSLSPEDRFPAIVSEQTQQAVSSVVMSGNDSVHALLDSLSGRSPFDSLPNHETQSNQKRTSLLTGGSWFIQATPVLTYQRLESNRNDEEYIRGVNSLPVFSFKRAGFRIEAGRTWTITPRLNVSLGLMYMQRRQQIMYSTRRVAGMEVIETSPGTVSMTPIFEDSIKTINIKSNSIGLGTQVSYLVTQSKYLKTYAGAGLDYQFTVSPKTFQQEFSESNRTLNLTLFYRVTYSLSRNAVIYLQPSYGYSLRNSASFSTALYNRPYTLGLGFGLMFTVK